MPQDKQKTWTARELAALLGVPLGRIKFYSERHGLLPQLRAAVGRGASRRYSKIDVIFLLVIMELVHYGMTISKMEDILDRLRLATERWWDEEKQAVLAETVILLHRKIGEAEVFMPGIRQVPESFTVNTHNMGSILVINLAELAKALDAQ